MTVPAELDQLPLLVRGGSIIPTRDRPRHASSLMHRDPFTLLVALDESLTAHGEIYLDDGVTCAHKDGHLACGAVCLWIASQRVAPSCIGRMWTWLPPLRALRSRAMPSRSSTGRIRSRVAPSRCASRGLSYSGYVARLSASLSKAKASATSTPGVAAADKKVGVASVLTIKGPRVGVASD